MNHLFNNEQKMTEIIFAHRNKAYGAYVLRSSYGETTLKALLTMIFGLSGIVCTGWYISKQNPPPPPAENNLQLIVDSLYTIPVDLEKKVEPPTPEQPSTANNKPLTSDNTIGTVVSETVETTSSSDSLVVNTTTTGDDKGLEGPVTGTNTTVKGISGPGSSTTTVAELHQVDKSPEFKGGLNALMRFIRDNTRYPQEAIDMGHGGKYFVRFIVDENGKVSQPTLLNSRYPELDAEVLRVVKIIPDFESPGMVKGQAVKTYYQLPFNFTLR